MTNGGPPSSFPVTSLWTSCTSRGANDEAPRHRRKPPAQRAWVYRRHRQWRPRPDPDGYSRSERGLL
eukprot:10939934-Alexandrium_andersonii.AAC.1